jgi:hypothetical protein
VTIIAPAPIARPPLVAGHQVDDVVEIALLLGVGRRILTREDAHEAHVVGAVAHDLEGLHEPSEAIAFDAHLLLDLGGRLRGAWILGRGRLGGRLGAGRLGRDLGPFRLRRSGRLGGHVSLDGGGRFDGALRRASRVDGRHGVRWRRDRLALRRSGGLRGLGLRSSSRRGRGAGGTMGTANHRRFAQDGAGELGDGLHWASDDLAEKGARLEERAPE